VRLENPIALAEWVLGDQATWTRQQIMMATSGPSTRHVRVERPVQVVLFYLTATVSPEDRTVHFAEDLYRHDAALDRALAAARRP
jgi:murein L,D-transpeptidase YcbB/YkuD